MNRWILSLGLIALTAFFVWINTDKAEAKPQQMHDLNRVIPEIAKHSSRACMFPIGGWTIIDCSDSAAATSGELEEWSRYVIMCLSNSYIAWGDEATDVADTNDGFLASGAWLEFLTNDAVTYVSCRNVTTDTDCRYIKCQ